MLRDPGKEYVYTMRSRSGNPRKYSVCINLEQKDCAWKSRGKDVVHVYGTPIASFTNRQDAFAFANTKGGDACVWHAGRMIQQKIEDLA